MKRRRLEILAPADGASCMGRREALGVILGGALVTYTACSSSTIEPPSTSADNDAGAGDDAGGAASCDNAPAGVDVGDVSTFPAGSWSAAGSANDPYVVGQDTNGYFAFSAVCTHQGCTVNPPSSTGKISCPCHGAQFDGNGAVVRGPARSPLPHYAVALCGSHLYVDSSTTVDASTRTAAS